MRQHVVLFAAVLLTGCSSYQVVKLNTDGSIPKDAAGGVPVTLGRPQFVVKKIEGSDPEQYQVSVTYVPDPDQRYAVRIEATPLANAELSLAFGDAGGLSSSSATVKDQVVPTTLALFKVAASAAVAFGTGGFLSKTQPSKIDDCLDVMKAPSQGARAQCVLLLLAADATSHCPSVADAADGPIDRLDPFIDADRKDKGEPYKTLFARNAAEQSCFDDAKTKVESAITSLPTLDPATLVNALKGQLQSNVVDTSNPTRAAEVRNAASEALSAAIESGDVATIKRWYYTLSDASLDQARLSALIPAPAQPDLQDAPKIVAALTAASLSPEDKKQTGLDCAQRIGDAKPLAAAFGATATLQPSDWRGRYIGWLQKRTERAERDALQADPSVDVRFDGTVRGYRAQVAALAGVRAEYDRWMDYLGRLKTLPAAAGADQRLSPTGEYENLRAQASALEQAIATAIAAKLTTDSAAKKPDPLPPFSPWIDARCIDKSKSEAWRYGAGASAAPFAIVLRRADGTAIAPSAGGVTCN